MLRRWITTRSWLVTWELLALFWLVVSANRYQRASALVSYDVGVTPMAWAILMDLIVSASVAVVCAVVGLLPAAWKSLGPSTRTVLPQGSGPLEPASARTDG